MKENLQTVQKINGYFNRLNSLKVLSLAMALAFVQGETFASSIKDAASVSNPSSLGTNTEGTTSSPTIIDVCGTNKVVNGDFENGNTGFTTGYTYTADVAGNTELIPENKYAVGTNSNNYHPQFIGTGRTGKFLIVNGNIETIKEVWSQDVNIISGREYKFKMYTQNIYPTAPVRFSFRITPNDGVSSPTEFGTFNAVTGRNGWVEVNATFNSDYTGSAKLSIIDIDITAFGNDFGIDDITFIETCPPIDCGLNRVVNGDFESGNTGFFTSYEYTADIAGNQELYPENRYSVGTNASNYHPVFVGTGRSGAGNFLLVNGNKESIKELWAQNLTVNSGKEYKFKMYVQNLSSITAARFSFRITPNDGGISAPVEFGAQTFAITNIGWVEVTATYNSDYTGEARLSIYDTDLTANGNDFGIDDISFIETCPCGINIIVNGNFEAGNSGFYTSYTYTADIAGNLELFPENKYSVGTNASNYHPVFVGTGRTGNFLIVNGNNESIKELWAQDVNVVSGKVYKFKMFMQNLSLITPARFSFRITPNDLLSSPEEFGTFNATLVSGWVEVTATYNSDYTGSARLSIYDIDITASGNDFGIDDISFIETCTPTDCGTNKIANGDFEAGNTGFNSSYNYTADVAGNSELNPPNVYTVGENGNNYHAQFIGTGRTGKFLIINGNDVSIKELWAQDVNVTSGSVYQFKMYTQNLSPTNPPRFSFRITPNDLLSSPVEFGTFNATAGRNGWIEVTATYNSDYTGSARLSIYDFDLSYSGNDFGIDDISFIEVCPTYTETKIAANTVNNETANVASISVYPNPFSDLVNVTISTGDLDKTATIRVVNYLGQQVYTHSLNVTPSSEINTSINLSDLSSGFYFLTVETNNSRETKKIIKK